MPNNLLLITPQIIDLPLKSAGGQPSQYLKINDYANFFPLNVVEHEATFVLECPLYNTIKDWFPLLTHSTILGSINLSSNWTIKLILAYILQRPLCSSVLAL